MAAAPKQKTIFRAASRFKPYSQICNAMIRDKRLSRDARLSLIFILSHPTDWNLSAEWLSRELNMGRDKTYKCVQELIAHGYCIRRQLRDAAGKHGSVEYFFTDEPGTLAAEPLPENQEAVTPHLVSPRPGLPDPVNQEAYIKKVSQQKHIDEVKTRASAKSASQGTDKVLPFTADVLAKVKALGVGVDDLLKRYGERTRGRRIKDPSAYLLRMAQDAAAKRLGVTADQVQASTSPNRAERIASATDATGAFSRPSDAALARVRNCAHLDDILAIIKRQRFATQEACDRAFAGEVTNARFRPPGRSALSATSLVKGENR